MCALKPAAVEHHNCIASSERTGLNLVNDSPEKLRCINLVERKGISGLHFMDESDQLMSGFAITTMVEIC